MPDGIGGVAPPRFVLATRLLPTYYLLWANEDRVWKLPVPTENVNPFVGFESDGDVNVDSLREQVCAETNPLSVDGAGN